jgi:hypothetical protein
MAAAAKALDLPLRCRRGHMRGIATLGQRRSNECIESNFARAGNVGRRAAALADVAVTAAKVFFRAPTSGSRGVAYYPPVR